MGLSPTLHPRVSHSEKEESIGHKRPAEEESRFQVEVHRGPRPVDPSLPDASMTFD